MVLALSPAATAQTSYDLLLKGGHVIDPRNGINAVRDVAIKGGKIAAVAPNIPAAQAKQTSTSPASTSRPASSTSTCTSIPARRRATYAGGDLSVCAGRLHAAQLRDDGRRRRQLRLAHVRGLQDARHRPLRRRASSPFSTSSASACAKDSSSRTSQDMEVQPTADDGDEVQGRRSSASRARTSTGPEWTPYERPRKSDGWPTSR